MAFSSKPLADPSHLAEIIKKAKEAFEAMTPAQKHAMCLKQRASWVIGEMMLEHPEMTYEEVQNIYDKVCR